MSQLLKPSLFIKRVLCESAFKPFLGNNMNDNFKVPHVRGLN